MIGLIIATLVFNFIAFKTNKRLSSIQIAHIWVFTIALQQSFDIYVDVKYHGYWYFSNGVDWRAIPAHLALLPPVNMMIINGFPFNSSVLKKVRYLILWEIALLTYESITLLPSPWGYFHYGWWNMWHSVFVNPILLIILLLYYKWISRACS
ncbi:hypothetical protein [Tuberibacillus sp. Marseille-P3662]|uniref:hypothetical protein n=1 Tax=Tuberibacillus sp. Marseille-P3662 TaxID=1965358 RepID=UPI000A1CB8AF|nr:hypothetical protein [Tuberibacillus sp. Marseille-P3662]